LPNAIKYQKYNTFRVWKSKFHHHHHPQQSTAGHRPLQFLAISLDLRLLAFSYCQPSCANRHSTWPEGVLHYVFLDAVSTPELLNLVMKNNRILLGFLCITYKINRCLYTYLSLISFCNWSRIYDNKAIT
jgi:hypothetical protein